MADRDGSGFLWFLAGLGIGAAMGIIFAPKSGEEVRKRIRDVAGESSSTIRERACQAREQAGDWTEKGREYLNQQKEQVRSAYEAGRKAYREASSKNVEDTTPNVP
jgi:gas vesicle protein